MLKVIAALAMLMTAVACSNRTEDREPRVMSNLERITPEQWRALSERGRSPRHHAADDRFTDSQLREYAARPSDASYVERRSHRYNNLLRAAYAGKEPIFDLAAMEATRPDGTPEYATVDASLSMRWPRTGRPTTAT